MGRVDFAHDLAGNMAACLCLCVGFRRCLARRDEGCGSCRQSLRIWALPRRPVCGWRERDLEPVGLPLRVRTQSNLDWCARVGHAVDLDDRAKAH